MAPVPITSAHLPARRLHRPAPTKPAPLSPSADSHMRRKPSARPVRRRALLLLLVLAFLVIYALNRRRTSYLTPATSPFPVVPASRPARRLAAAAKLSVVVLYHNELDSLRHSAASWVANGLADAADELLLFLNGIRSADALVDKIPALAVLRDAGKLRIEPSQKNLPLGLAIARMVELASHPYVLLLEKDWELVESRDVLWSRLVDSKALIREGVAHVVRHRHRENPGVPLHALIMHQGREESILRIQKNLLCYVHHWQSDPSEQYPGKGKMWRCGSGEGTAADVDERDVFCATSEYCQWTNNPCVFSRQWFIDEMGNEFRKQYKIEKDKEGASSPFLDFEYYTNWRSYAWTDKNYTIAVGAGLFKHAEKQEQLDFNTFWYAHYRLTVDLEEIRDTYLRNETAFKQLGGVHYDPASPIPLTMMERYPVDFARKHHWASTFTGDLNTQRAMIAKDYQPYLDKYRILTEEEWAQTGKDSEKASQAINWRGHITMLQNTVRQAMMIAPPKQPHEMTITLVTCLLDIGRHGLAADSYQFKRDFKMYLDAMQDWLTHVYPKVVYTSQEVADELTNEMSEAAKASTKFIITTREELRTKWIGPDNYEKIQEIRQSEDWLSRASWLRNSPQAGLQDYNPLVMAKMFMMRDAARKNVWGTSHFLFVDAKHNCRQPKIMTPKNDHIIRAHMFDKLLMTHFDYTPGREVHGFEYKAFNSYCNMKNAEERQLVKVGRGGIFGGSGFVLEYITAMYDVALTATLRAGLMGTEENIFSVLFYQVPQYVDAFSNNWACPEKIEKDHSCPDLKDQGYNCAIFEWVARNAVEES